MVPDAVVPDPDEVAWHGWLTEPEVRSALLEWRFTPDSHEAFSRYLAFGTARPCPPRSSSAWNRPREPKACDLSLQVTERLPHERL